MKLIESVLQGLTDTHDFYQDAHHTDAVVTSCSHNKPRFSEKMLSPKCATYLYRCGCLQVRTQTEEILKSDKE